MRSTTAPVAFALIVLAASPSALARSTVTVPAGIVAALGSPHAATVARKDTRRSCQVAASRSAVKLPGPASVTEGERRASTVACEEPPRAKLNISGAVSAAETGAVEAGG